MSQLRRPTSLGLSAGLTAGFSAIMFFSIFGPMFLPSWVHVCAFLVAAVPTGFYAFQTYKLMMMQ